MHPRPSPSLIESGKAKAGLILLITLGSLLGGCQRAEQTQEITKPSLQTKEVDIYAGSFSESFGVPYPEWIKNKFTLEVAAQEWESACPKWESNAEINRLKATDFKHLDETLKGPCQEIANAEARAEAEEMAKQAKELTQYKEGKTSQKVGDFIFTVSKVGLGKKWQFDVTPSEAHYRQAERGLTYILLKARIKSKTHRSNPLLPPVAVYRWVPESQVFLIRSKFEYKFASWKSHAAYLKLQTDYDNSYAHTETVDFSLAADLMEDDNQYKLLVVAKDAGCFSRVESNRPGSDFRETDSRACDFEHGSLTPAEFRALNYHVLAYAGKKSWN
jgi:hypothetical protein